MMYPIPEPKRVIAFSCGDLNGVGIPLLIKIFSDSRMLQMCTPVLYASGKVLNFYRKDMGLQDWNYNIIQEPSQAHPRKFNLINCWQDEVNLKPGEADAGLSRYARISLRQATEDCLKGRVHGLVTLPIDKNLMQSGDFQFPGHTEFLEEAARKHDPAQFKGRSLMWLVADSLRVAALTGHIPLQEVAGRITCSSLTDKVMDMLSSLALDFAIPRPRIAVLGLNPHAGDSGLLGHEEANMIQPTIRILRDQGHLVFGPYGADGFWGTGAWSRFDAVLGMYHDQVLIPFKTLAFEQGVNFTGGLPVIRCSPDHGPAFEKAAERRASPSSILHAIFFALDRIRIRGEQRNLAANALVKTRLIKETETSEES
jgi:4-hydroxythreonine-4-phosphate dehydrogenase